MPKQKRGQALAVVKFEEKEALKDNPSAPASIGSNLARVVLTVGHLMPEFMVCPKLRSLAVAVVHRVFYCQDYDTMRLTLLLAFVASRSRWLFSMRSCLQRLRKCSKCAADSAEALGRG